MISENSSVDLGKVFRSFTDPEFVKKFGVPVSESGKVSFLVKTVIKTKKVGEITLASRFVDGSARQEALPYLLLTEEQVKQIRKKSLRFRIDLGKQNPDSKGMYVYCPTRWMFEKIASM